MRQPAICGYTLVCQGKPDPFLNYDGSPLRRCSGCKGMTYINQDAQKKHWKRHKPYCRLPSPSEIESIATADLATCETKLRDSRLYVEGGPELYHYMKRLRVLYDEGVDGASDSAFKLHSLARGIIFYPSLEIGLAMAASPNMARLLFGEEEDLLNKKTRLAKHQLGRYNGRPSEEFIDAIEDEDEKRILRRLCDQYDELDNSWSEPSSMSYCYLYFNLIVACAIHGESSMASFHDGNGTLRGGDPRKKNAEALLATAALRKAMSLWTDKHVLASCGDAMAPAASLAITAVNYYDEIGILGGVTCREHELVPGLFVDDAILTCMSELLEGAGSAQYSLKLLKLLGQLTVKASGGGNKNPWEDLSIERRAKVVLAIVRYVMEGGGSDRGSYYGKDIKMPSDAVNSLFNAASNVTNLSDSESANPVWHKAASDGECIGPYACGMNWKSRAFIYYLLRKNVPVEEWKQLQVVELEKEFSDIPRIHKAPDDAKAKEKDECMRLAQGDKLHAELNAIYSR